MRWRTIPPGTAGSSVPAFPFTPDAPWSPRYPRCTGERMDGERHRRGRRAPAFRLFRSLPMRFGARGLRGVLGSAWMENDTAGVPASPRLRRTGGGFQRSGFSVHSRCALEPAVSAVLRQLPPALAPVNPIDACERQHLHCILPLHTAGRMGHRGRRGQRCVVKV